VGCCDDREKMGGMKEIQLTNGKVTKVDDHLFDELNKYKWRANKMNGQYYVVRWDKSTGKGRAVLMHRVILGVTDRNVQVDHKDLDPLNNQLYNIRRATHKENSRNRGITKRSTCGYKGVFWEKRANKWRAQLGIDDKKIHLGLFHDIKDAARAYNAAALIHHGEFARLNEIPA